MSKAFPTHPVKHVVSKGIQPEINSNLSERLQGTVRDRDKTLRGLKHRDTGQNYLDGLTVHYNYFRPRGGLAARNRRKLPGLNCPLIAGQTWQPYGRITASYLGGAPGR